MDMRCFIIGMNFYVSKRSHREQSSSFIEVCIAGRSKAHREHQHRTIDGLTSGQMRGGKISREFYDDKLLWIARL